MPAPDYYEILQVLPTLPVAVSNFEAHLKALFPRKNGKGAECGLFFRKSRDGFYKFAVRRDGYTVSRCESKTSG